MKIIEGHKTEEVIKEIYHYECDKCLNPIEMKDMYNASECIIYNKRGLVFPEGDFSEIEEINLCTECAEKLFEELKKMGFRTNIRTGL